MEKQLPSLTVVACCTVALSACSQTAAPPTRPQASAESVVDIAEPADSGSDSGVSFAMPEPGPFVPGPDVDIFKPCEEIPDEVFAELGLRKELASQPTSQTQACDLIDLDTPGEGAALSISVWDVPIDVLISGGHFEFERKIPEIEHGILARQTYIAQDSSCEALVETVNGVVGIAAMDMFNPSAKSTVCERPEQIALRLFGGR